MLYITYNWFSPSFKAGGPSRSLLHLVHEISNEIDITVICSSRDYDGKDLDVVTNRFISFLGIARVWYSKESTIFSWSMFIRKQSARLWYINGLYSFRFSILPLWLGKGAKIICPRGMLDPGSLNKKSRKKQLFLFFFKIICWRRAIIFHAASEIEAKNIQNIMGNNVDVKIIPNFPKLLDQLAIPNKKMGCLTLTTIALIGSLKNHLKVLQALQKCPYQIDYIIYGPILDQVYWSACLNQIDMLPSNITVKYRGSIKPDQIEEALLDSHVYIQPSSSENFGHSLIEALSAGKPIITSNNTPWNNLENANAGINVEHSNIQAITDAIDYFACMDEKSFQVWSKGAHEYAIRAIQIGTIKNDYLELFNH